MIEGVVLLVAIFAGGYWTGHETPSISCINNALVTENCVIPDPPQDGSFGTVSLKMLETIGNLKRCKSACEATK